MFENYILSFALICSIITQALYAFSMKKKDLLRWANISYNVSVASIIAVSLALFANIVGHNFQMSYVYEYSSIALPKFLLYSSFFAGQEGSFVLWALMIALIGKPLKKQIKGNDIESGTMFIYNAILLMFILLIVMKSPFTYIWDKFPDRFAIGVMPPDGRSLNPILENFWLVIHPPFLFLGYSLLAVPFALGIASFAKGEYHKWLTIARNWQLLGSAILGVGLILGGFWAYESLGWGGWWGWDPVENASLIPWLISVVLIHTILLQQRNKGFVKSNLFLVSSQLVLIIYSTFLTRTGILQNSMHSFAGTSESVFYTLLIAMIIMLLATIAILARAYKTIPNPKENMPINSREFFISIGVFIILIITMFVFYGTSIPILDKDIAIEPSFYDKVNFIPAIIAMLAITISMIMKWKRTELNQAIKDIIAVLIFAVIITVLTFLTLLNGASASIGNILFVFSAATTVATGMNNLINIKKNNATIQSAVAHLGIGVLLIAVIFSGAYSSKKVISLGNGQTNALNNYNFKYIKSQQVEKIRTDRETYQFIIEAENGSNKSYLLPIMFIKDAQLYKEPAINSQLGQDIYIAPLALDSVIQCPNAILSKMQQIHISNTNIDFRFINFVMPNSDESEIGAEVQYTINNAQILDTIYAKIDMQTLQCKLEFKPIKQSDRLIGINSIVMDKNSKHGAKIHFVFPMAKDLPVQKAEIFSFEVSIKPIMNWIWIGSFLAILGTFLAIRRRK